MAVHFPAGSAVLSDEARALLRKVGAMHRERGGTVRVVGHASPGSQEVSLARQKLANFETSLARAQAVAKALMANGVAPERLFIETKSDGEPSYPESMSSGEKGNQGAEVFLDF